MLIEIARLFHVGVKKDIQQFKGNIRNPLLWSKMSN